MFNADAEVGEVLYKDCRFTLRGRPLQDEAQADLAARAAPGMDKASAFPYTSRGLKSPAESPAGRGISGTAPAEEQSRCACRTISCRR